MGWFLTHQRTVLGILLIVMGTALTVTLLGAVIGIPLVLFGLWLTLQKSSDE